MLQNLTRVIIDIFVTDGCDLVWLWSSQVSQEASESFADASSSDRVLLEAPSGPSPRPAAALQPIRQGAQPRSNLTGPARALLGSGATLVCLTEPCSWMHWMPICQQGMLHSADLDLMVEKGTGAISQHGVGFFTGFESRCLQISSLAHMIHPRPGGNL